MSLAALPVGFERFHRRPLVNYQLNRAYALGFAERADLAAAAAIVRTPNDCGDVFEAASARAERQGRLENAASYMRIAEFFTPHRSDAKLDRYRRFRMLFDAALHHTGVVRHAVPYRDSTLPAYRLPAIGGPARGTVLLHGGFDSLIEEFFVICHRIASAGFDVVAFDGPGQGGARRLGGLVFDHDWEEPVGAVLDHFAIERASIVGISMGGYWALRAAGLEPRIDRVVAWPPVFDWMWRVPGAFRPAVRLMLKRRCFMRTSVRVRAQLVPTLRFVVDQALYNIDRTDPMDAVDWFLGMNAAHLGSDRVTQPVLLMCGEHDRFQPPVLTRAQAGALTAARSVTVRTFTEAEHADQHCQMGNLELACQVVTTWLRAPGD